MKPAHTKAASRGLERRELKLEAKNHGLCRAIRKVNFNSYKEIAAKVSINPNKDLTANLDKVAPLLRLGRVHEKLCTHTINKGESKTGSTGFPSLLTVWRRYQLPSHGSPPALVL